MKTYDALITERIVNAAQQQPRWPKVFKSKVQQEVHHHHKSPDEKDLQVDQATEKSQILNCII